MIIFGTIFSAPAREYPATDYLTVSGHRVTGGRDDDLGKALPKRCHDDRRHDVFGRLIPATHPSNRLPSAGAGSDCPGDRPGDGLRRRGAMVSSAAAREVPAAVHLILFGIVGHTVAMSVSANHSPRGFAATIWHHPLRALTDAAVRIAILDYARWNGCGDGW